MSFKFKMQKVLEYREQLEEEAKVRLADAQARYRQASERLDELREEFSRASQQARDNMLMNSGECWLHEQYLKGLKADVTAQAMQTRLLAQATEEARKMVAERAIERKMLDKLKERQKKQYVQEENQRERHFNDEIATLRHKAPSVKAGASSGRPLPDQDHTSVPADA